VILPQEGCLLRVFVGEDDRHDGKPLYEWLVLKAREQGLAGATVVRGVMGFGASSRLHTFRIERFSLDLPMVIEIVDTRPKLEAFLADVDPVIHDGLATLERAEVRFYRSRGAASTK
jgi:PII-like signaling protein